MIVTSITVRIYVELRSEVLRSESQERRGSNGRMEESEGAIRELPRGVGIE
jgi:hypothetical protein